MQRLPPDFVPTAMFETERFLVLHSPKQGIWLFDNLGSPLTQLPNNKNDPPAQNVQVYNSMLFFTRGTQLYRLRLDTPVLKGKQKDDLRDFTVVPVRLAPLVTPLDSTDVIRIENRTLFVARKDRIEVYRF